MAVHSKTNDPDPADFEFSSAGFPGSPSAMCAADDVFLSGKILPFGASPPGRHQNSAGKLRSRDSLEVNPPRTTCAVDDIFFTGKIIPSSDSPPQIPQISSGELRRQDSPNADRLRRSWWGAAGSKAGYRRLRKVSDCDERELPEPASSRPQHEPQRPRWLLFVLGSVRVPETMRMDDIRNRQRRRSLAAEPGGDMGRGTLRLLRSLSCRRLESATVVAAPPLGFASRVNGT
ncbi:hypothetical protein ZIOFF_067413 [Zingiber officinale]|uniref:Uncharacterized protein n=1 Tax=Zingiber officinale TaxID=94328 RepID=A0A8J5CFP4_ZINOF|nr:hypothetical protein ZIOFF_067413 [Zingiber officinale]